MPLFASAPLRHTRQPGHAARAAALMAHTLPRKGPGEEAEEDEEELELPVAPDEGTPLAPDEEGEVNVPF